MGSVASATRRAYVFSGICLKKGREFPSLRGLLLTTLVLVLSSHGLAQGDNQTGTTAAADTVAIENYGASIEIEGKPIFSVYAKIGSLTPEERAVSIEKRIVALSKSRAIPIDAIHAEDRGTWTEIVAGTDRIMGITEVDAEGAEATRGVLAAACVSAIREAVKNYRDEHSTRHLVWASLYAFEATLACVVVLIFLFWSRTKLRSVVEQKLGQIAASPSRALGLRIGAYFGRPLLFLSRIAFWIVVLVVLQVYVTLVLRFFPATQYTSYQITNLLFSELASFGKLVVGYTPNLILLAFICLIASALIKLNKVIFTEIRDERLTVRGFYPDWAEPTAKLVRALIITVTVIVAFPYLPGSDSPAFKGISVFLGVLLSLGSSSAVAHAVSGTILTYMRAFQIGDFVRIGTDVGEVVEKTLLVTRIKTQKSEVITIPNGTVLGGVVVNYSAEGRKRGVIFHTVVSIGYSAPWRQVHDLLISAAQATEGILHDPAPFVLQTALNDFYVSYELNAYTGTPGDMQNVYSRLHQNIQDRFNEAGVEINSPHYTALRDGNDTTIPENYRPKDYKRATFEVQHTNAMDRNGALGQDAPATNVPIFADAKKAASSD